MTLIVPTDTRSVERLNIMNGIEQKFCCYDCCYSEACDDIDDVGLYCILIDAFVSCHYVCPLFSIGR